MNTTTQTCPECDETVVSTWRRKCCACGKTLHDECWKDDRLMRAYEGLCEWGVCECGGGFNLHHHDEKLTRCSGQQETNCRC